MAQQITENMIREAAYFLWEKAGRPDGSAEYFWMKACEQFFKPKKVEIKKPAAKKVQPKKAAPVKKAAPAPKAATPAKKPAVKVVAKPAVAPAKTVKKVVIKVQPRPVAKPGKGTTVPFYGSRK